MQVVTGTSGFAYKEWKGSFYPDDLPANRMLKYYAGRLHGVEINNTFYRMPKPHVLEQWAAQVPPDFTFVLKASRWITHRKRLKEVEEPVSYFFDHARVLGDRLGPILVQLPPNLKKNADRLEGFLAAIPAGGRVALEFRHESWFDDDVFALLERSGAALCIAEAEDIVTPRVATTDWGYLRLRRPEYTDAELRDWVDWTAAQDWTRVCAFFKHEDGATGPSLAAHFGTMLNARLRAGE